MTWAFGSPLFGIHAAVRVVIVTVIWFARPDWRVIVLPATVAFAYLITVILIPRLRRKWLAKHHD
jgi:membrane protein YdbS with pleckstrin-like domain